MRLKNIKGASEKILEGKYFISNPKDYRGKWNKLFNNPILSSPFDVFKSIA